MTYSRKKFVDKYYLNPFINKKDKKYRTQPFWTKHFKKSKKDHIKPLPQNIGDLEFYHNVNLLIEERGKWIIKILCEEHYPKDLLPNLTFYKELKKMKKIKTFEEIIN